MSAGYRTVANAQFEKTDGIFGWHKTCNHLVLATDLGQYFSCIRFFNPSMICYWQLT